MDGTTRRSRYGFMNLPRWAARVLYELTGDVFAAALIRPRRREPYHRTREPLRPSNGTAERHHRS